MPEPAIRLLIGIAPVLALLAALVYLDSYKLIRPGGIASSMAMGGMVAGLSYVLNVALIGWSGLELRPYARYVAPPVEEIGKALLIIYMVRVHRIGFLVDAAIYGFAVGTGFAVIENIYYAQFLPQAHLAVWLVRGFGTAIMHGSTTAIVAMTARALADRMGTGHDLGRPASALRTTIMFLPGLLLAVLVHSLFNHFLLNPVLSTMGVLVLLPPLVFAVFTRSEASLRSWLDVGLDADAELLALVHSGEFSRSRVGGYLQSLRNRFQGVVVADMLCYLRIHVELSMAAKGRLMMQESGFKVEPDPTIRERLDELDFLERSIGRTGKLAMSPILHTSGRDIWQLSMLRK